MVAMSIFYIKSLQLDSCTFLNHPSESVCFSCLVEVFMLFHPVGSSAQQRPALGSERGRDSFLTLHFDLMRDPENKWLLCFFLMCHNVCHVKGPSPIIWCQGLFSGIFDGTHLTALLRQDAIPLVNDLYPLGLPLPDQFRWRAQTPDTAQHMNHQVSILTRFTCLLNNLNSGELCRAVSLHTV